MNWLVRVCAIAGLLVLCRPTMAAAQRDRLLVDLSPPAQWAVTFSLTPEWEIKPVALSELAGADRDDIRGPDGQSTFGGSDWSIGFARGRALGRDWGVSFVRQRIHRDAVIDRTFDSSGGGAACFPDTCAFGERIVFRDVAVTGSEAHLYVPFVTIKERVQIGVMLAGGGGKFSGTALVDRFDPISTPAGLIGTRTQLEGPVTEVTRLIYFGNASEWTLMGRIQPGVAVMVSSHVKIHAGAGFYYPGTTVFALRATYFFPRADP
jgi:hypothetical protein